MKLEGKEERCVILLLGRFLFIFFLGCYRWWFLYGLYCLLGLFFVGFGEGLELILIVKK